MIKRLSVDNPSIKNLRVYGIKPYSVAVVHGGPGAAGEMAPVAEELSSELGILEPFQSALSIDGQIEELKGLLENAASHAFWSVFPGERGSVSCVLPIILNWSEN